MNRFPQRVLLRAPLLACAALFAVLAQPACAASCTISTTPVSFGIYDVFAMNPNNNGIGSLTLVCSTDAGNVALSTGQSNTYAARVMRSGANPLTYNLYTSAARTRVWGDGSGGSRVMRAAEKATTIFSIYGQIPAGQDAAVGTYTDNITVTITF
ncbi:MAG: spore coat U domain-containing protein [Sterolibacterium sp.]